MRIVRNANGCCIGGKTRDDSLSRALAECGRIDGDRCYSLRISENCVTIGPYVRGPGFLRQILTQANAAHLAHTRGLIRSRGWLRLTKRRRELAAMRILHCNALSLALLL